MKSCDGFWPPEALSYFTTVMSILFCIFAVAGNGLVGVLIILDPMKALRTPANYFILNLALSDMMVACITLPLSSYWHYKESTRLGLASHSTVLHLAFFISITACCLSHIALSIDRYFAVRSPMAYRNNISMTRSYASSVLIWVISGLTPLLYFKLGYLTYLMVFANGALLLTLLVLSAVCFAVHKSLHSHEKELVENEKRSQTERRVSVFLELRQKKVTRVLLVVILFFVICTSPAVVFIYVINFCKTCPCLSVHVMRDLQLLFVLSTSAINPFICTLRLPTFYMSLKRLFKCFGDCLPSSNEKLSARESKEPPDTGPSPIAPRQRRAGVCAVIYSNGLQAETVSIRSSNSASVIEFTGI